MGAGCADGAAPAVPASMRSERTKEAKTRTARGRFMPRLDTPLRDEPSLSVNHDVAPARDVDVVPVPLASDHHGPPSAADGERPGRLADDVGVDPDAMPAL